MSSNRKMPHTPRGRRLRFSLFSLVIVLPIAACLFACVLEDAYDAHRTMRRLQESGVRVSHLSASESAWPSFLRNWLGTPWASDAVQLSFPLHQPVTSEQLRDVGRLRHVISLDICFTIEPDGTYWEGFDEALQFIAHNKQLRYLDLRATGVSGNGLQHLKPLKGIASLSLCWNPIDDDALRHLSEFRELEELTLMYTNVTDAGLVHLDTLPKLEDLYLEGTTVTPEGAAAFVARHPSLRLHGVRLGDIQSPPSAAGKEIQGSSRSNRD